MALYDIVIHGGRLVDGTGNPWFYGDVAIKDGRIAAIVVFDPDTVFDTATYENPKQYPRGIDYVLVNGAVVIEGGSHTGARPGRVIYGPGKVRSGARLSRRKQ